MAALLLALMLAPVAAGATCICSCDDNTHETCLRAEGVYYCPGNCTASEDNSGYLDPRLTNLYDWFFKNQPGYAGYIKRGCKPAKMPRTKDGYGALGFGLTPAFMLLEDLEFKKCMRVIDAADAARRARDLKMQGAYAGCMEMNETMLLVDEGQLAVRVEVKALWDDAKWCYGYQYSAANVSPVSQRVEIGLDTHAGVAPHLPASGLLLQPGESGSLGYVLAVDTQWEARIKVENFEVKSQPRSSGRRGASGTKPKVR